MAGRRKAQVTDSDRVFSQSSASYMLVGKPPEQGLLVEAEYGVFGLSGD
jgi:hypothetical protein